MTRDLARLIIEASGEQGMTRSAQIALAVLADDNGDVAITSHELGKAIGTNTYTAGRHIRALMQSGAITRLARGRGTHPSRYHVNAPTGTA